MVNERHQKYFIAFLYTVFVFTLLIISLPQYDFFPTYKVKISQTSLEEDRSIDSVSEDASIDWKEVYSGHKVFNKDNTEIWSKFSFTNETNERDWTIGNIFSSYSSMDYYILRSDGSINEIAVDRSSGNFLPQIDFKLAPNESVTIYSRTNYYPFWMVDNRILPKKQFAFGSQLLMMFSATYLGALFILSLGGLSSFFTLKDKSYLFFFTLNSSLAVFYLILNGNFISFLGFPFEVGITVFRLFWCIGIFASLSFIYFIKSFLYIESNSTIKAYTAFSLLSMLAFFALDAENVVALLIINLFATNILTVYLVYPYLKLANIRDIIVGIAGVSATLLISSLAFSNVLEQTTINIRLYCIGNLWMGLCFYLALSKRVYALHEEKQTLSSILSGNTPKTALNEIINRPYGFSYTFKEQNVTILFIDIVGFSLSSEKLGASESFSALSRWLNEIYHIIEETGGHIDRSLGDGFLCFFGYNSHDPMLGARKAFKAAVEIQTLAVESMSKDVKKLKAFPLRIGMNTDKVVIGNLGGEKRTDYTMIGDGVNFASRLESACNSFKISLSETTHKLLKDDDYIMSGMNKIFIKIKHHHNFKTAFEYNPFINKKKLLIDAEHKYYKSLSATIKEQRKNTTGLNISLSSDVGSFEVLDFSESGFGVTSEIFLGPKTQFNVLLKLNNEDLNLRLKEKFLNSFSVEVRWSRRSNDKFKHGFKLLGLNQEQRNFILQLLEEYSAAEEAADWNIAY